MSGHFRVFTFLSQFTLFCVSFWGPTLRSRNFFDKYENNINASQNWDIQPTCPKKPRIKCNISSISSQCSNIELSRVVIAAGRPVYMIYISAVTLSAEQSCACVRLLLDDGQSDDSSKERTVEQLTLEGKRLEWELKKIHFQRRAMHTIKKRQFQRGRNMVTGTVEKKNMLPLNKGKSSQNISKGKSKYKTALLSLRGDLVLNPNQWT